MGHIDQAIEEYVATPSYYACLLIVHPEIRRLQQVVDGVVAARGWPRLSVGRQLSTVLIAEPTARRPQKASLWVDSAIRQMAPGPVLCSEIDLLFEPALQLDPLAALRQASRTTRIVVAWPGSYSDSILSYAVPEHSRYRIWSRPDVYVLALE